jgi:hypothetical protein
MYSLGFLVVSDVGGVRNADGCRFTTNISRSDDRFRRATIDLHMWHAVGIVEPRNLGRPKHTGNSRAIFLLAFGSYNYGWLDMSSRCAVSRYSGYSWL